MGCENQNKGRGELKARLIARVDALIEWREEEKALLAVIIISFVNPLPAELQIWLGMY